MFHQKSIKGAFIFTFMLILAACEDIGPSPSLSSSIAPTPTSLFQSLISSSSSSSSSINYIPITNSEELNNIRNDLSGNYTLMNDIDLESKEWIPIGTNLLPFIGVIDGQGFTIRNLVITTSNKNIGFIGVNYGTIKNIILDGIDIGVVSSPVEVVSGLWQNVIYGGAFIGFNRGKVENIKSINGKISIERANCELCGSNSTGAVGGLIGLTNTSEVEPLSFKNLSNAINVTGLGVNAGGLIGKVTGDSSIFIIDSSNFGNVNSEKIGPTYGNPSVGGLIAHSDVNTNFINCLNSGHLGGGTVGGLIGEGNTTTIKNSFNSGSVTSNNGGVGGLVGVAQNISVRYSVNFGNLTSTSNTNEIGGITGALPAINDIEKTYYSGAIIVNGVAVDGVAFGTKVTDLTTFNLAFFTTTLGWDTEVWDFTGLDIANGVYPTLKNILPVEE